MTKLSDNEAKSCYDQHAVTNQRPAVKKEQPVTSNKRKAMADERPGTRNKQQTTSFQLPTAPSNQKHGTNNLQAENKVNQRTTINQRSATIRARPLKPGTSNLHQTTNRVSLGTKKTSVPASNEQRATNNIASNSPVTPQRPPRGKKTLFGTCDMFARPKQQKRKRTSKQKPMSTPLKQEPKAEKNNAQRKIMSHFKVYETKGPSQNNPCASGPGSIKAKSEDSNDQDDLYPLSGPGIKWYEQKGVNAVTNRSREERKENTNGVRTSGDKYFIRNSVAGNLEQNIEVLMRKLSEAGSESKQKHLKAMITLGNYIIENGPLVQTRRSLQENTRRRKGSLFLSAWRHPDYLEQ